ncbi:MAG TPA: glycine cleavage system aminomethyltransferase GcvT [Mycobacteriales bacterium]|nr:glycine cleavage system aminomethyltransferase GcvT [Mycobacteriales bacterium]
MTDHAPIPSPLADRHQALGAKLAEFGGWSMPLSYSGVVDEHVATRTAVGLFDVSHLGKVLVSGSGAVDFVNRCFTNDLDRIGAGQAQYSLCCDEETGGVVDDVIVYREDDEVFVVPNAANTAEVIRRMQAAAPAGITIDDRHRAIATLAVQGPRSAEVLDAVGLPQQMDYMAFARTEWQGLPVTVCRTGYTGEHGYELMPGADRAGELWDALLEAARPLGGLPCGLGARDTLRTEMGYPLHGQDLSIAVTPVQARLGWAIGWQKPEFWGRDVLTREREVGAPRLLWGLRSEDRGIPRPHMPVRSLDHDELGEVTSGTFSPTLRVGIGLALLSRAVGDGGQVRVDVRGKPSQMQVVKPPFVELHTR